MIKLFNFFKKNKPLNTKVLRAYKNEANARLRFVGSWSGYWTTVIDGIHYRGNIVSGFKYVSYEYGNFIRDAIIDRARLRKDKAHKDETLTMAMYGRERYIDDNGEASWW